VSCPRPSYGELTAVLLTGLGHVALELLGARAGPRAGALRRPEQAYNAIASVLWCGYVLWRALGSPGMLRAWGFRTDNFARALKPTALFAGVAAFPLLLYGTWRARLPLPPTFYLLLLLYPLWGLAQQFALQALITKNLRAAVPALPLRAPAAALLFSAAHFPNYPLMILTFGAGLGFTWLHEKHRNLWAVGLAHGLLGALAYYLVLGQDPGADILELIP